MQSIVLFTISTMQSMQRMFTLKQLRNYANFIEGDIIQGDDCFDVESCPEVSSVPLIVYNSL